MLVVPITADQPYSAQRCTALGIGCAIAPDNRTAVAIRDGVRRLLSESTYRDSAQRFQAEMQALPGRDDLVNTLEATARDRAAVL